MRDEKRQPLPWQQDRESQALAFELDTRADHKRSKDDSGRQQGADAAGSRSVTIAAGETGIIHHGLGHEPIGWRVIDATGSPASHIHSFGHHTDADPSGPATETHWIVVASFAMVMVEAFILPNGPLTAHDSNYAILSFGHYHPSGPSTDIVGSMTTQTTGTGTGDWVAGTPIKLSDFSAIEAHEMEPGTVTIYDIDKSAGAGVALPDHEVIFEHVNTTGCWVRRVSWDSKELILSNENNYDLTMKVEVF